MTKPATSKFAKVDDTKHLAALRAMSAVSTEGNPSGEWLRLARLKSNGELRDALRGVGLDIDAKGAAHRFGHWCTYVRDKPFSDGEGGPYVLRSRFYPGDRAWRHGVAHPDREAIIARREKTATTKAAIEEQGKEIARQLRKNPDPVAAVRAIIGNAAPTASKPTAASIAPAAEQSHLQALEETRRAGWFTPIGTRSPAAPAIEPTVAPSTTPAPVPEPAPVDMTGWPPAWRKFGKPSYRTVTHLDGDWRQSDRPGGGFFLPAHVHEQAGTAAENGDFVTADRNNNCPRSPLPR